MYLQKKRLRIFPGLRIPLKVAFRLALDQGKNI